MSENVRKFFACANTSSGFVNFFDSNLLGLDKIYILKGGPGTGKSTLMKNVSRHFESQGEMVELIYCSSDTDSLDGVILKDRKAAIVDGTAPHVIEPNAPGAIEEYVNLGEAWDSQKLVPYKCEILDLNTHIREKYHALYHILEKAKKVHDDLEKIYISHMDFEKLESVQTSLCESLFEKVKKGEKGEKGESKDRFFGAMTPDGTVNYIENLTADCQKRYFIEGRPGTGKSSLLKGIVSEAQKHGLDTEVYHCSFDPKSLDMVILPSLGTALFDATNPHKVIPSKESDEVVDLYKISAKQETDEAFSEKINLLKDAYEELLHKARKIQKTIRQTHDALEIPYIKAMNYKTLEKMTKTLIKKLQKL